MLLSLALRSRALHVHRPSLPTYRYTYAQCVREHRARAPEEPQPHPDVHVDFEDTVKAYRSKTTRELLRHFVVFSAFKYNGIINRSHKLVKLSQRWLGQRLFRRIMKMTVYGQFVAGEDLEALQPVIRRYRKDGIRAILDYAVEEDILDEEEVVLETRTKAEGSPVPLEMSPYDPKLFPQYKSTITHADTTARASARTYFYATEKKCDDVMKNFLACVNMAADSTEPGDAAFAAIKLTGLGRVEFLLRLSEVVEGTQQLFVDLADSSDIFTAQVTPHSFYNGLSRKGVKLMESEADRLYKQLDTDNKKTIGVFEWLNRFQPGNELYKLFRSHKDIQPLLAVMEDHDLEQMQSVVRRAHTIAECAEERKVRLMIDAEQTYFQPAIRHIAVYILMPKYNREYPLVFNTVQCYLKKAKETLHMDLEYSKSCGFSYGVKLVRGAYLEQEKEGALAKTASDPVWSSKGETDECYDYCVEYVMRHIQDSNINMMVATHNEESVKNAINIMKKYKIGKNDGAVVFGQLLGMCDHISLTLGNEGHICYKYMPYGPVEDVIPYLIRRAFENKGFLKGADQERRLVETELRRRLFH